MGGIENAKVSVEDYCDVKIKAKGLGFNTPTDMTILARNFDSADSKEQLLYDDTVGTVRKLWKQNSITEKKLESDGERYRQISEHAFEWIGPTIFVPASLLITNPYMIDLALGVIANYLTDFFKGIEDKKVKISIVTETKNGGYKKIKYDGSIDGIRQLTKIVREVYDK